MNGELAGQCPATANKAFRHACRKEWSKILERARYPLARALILALAFGLLMTARSTFAYENSRTSEFIYAGGTESIQGGCGGKLELTHSSMTFQCPEGSITIPYHSITLMQYRPSLSRAVRHMKLPWKVKPNGSGGKKNLFFTVLYKRGDQMHALVLRVQPEEMRPYLAEIELSTGKRIQVWDYRGFD